MRLPESLEEYLVESDILVIGRGFDYLGDSARVRCDQVEGGSEQMGK